MPVESAGKTLYEQYRYVAIQYEFALQRALEEYGDLDLKVDFKPMLVTLGKLCFAAGVEEEDCVKWTLLYWGNLISEVEIRETLAHAYQLAPGSDFGSTPLHKPEQLQALKMEEFMSRRYDFRYNLMSGGPEYREKNTFCFDYRPVTDRVLNSIALNAQRKVCSYGTEMYGVLSFRTVFRIIRPSKITWPVYPRGTARTVSVRWLHAFRATMCGGNSCFTPGFCLWWRTGRGVTNNTATVFLLCWWAARDAESPLSVSICYLRI